MKKVLGRIISMLSSIINEFIEGFFPEYLLTGIAGTIFLIYYSVIEGFQDIGIGFWFVFAIDALLIVLGVRWTILNKRHNNKVIAFVNHILTFFIIGFVGKIVLSILFVIAIAIGLIAFLNGAEAVTSFFDFLTPTTDYPKPKQKEKVEVWRENGMMRENLKVNSSGDMYYDPDDGEWHKIQK